MSSEELGLVPPQNSNLTSQPHLFPEESSLRFARGDSCPKTRDLGSTSGFIGDRFFSSQGPELRRSLYPSNGPDLRDPTPPAPPNWNGSDTQSGDATDGNDDDDEDEDDDVDEVPVGEVSVKDGASVQASARARASSSEIQRQGHMGNYHNAVTIAEADGELYYAYLRGTTSGQKDVVASQCGFSGRKEAAFHSESGDSLRSILSDPITGDLMDDAMVLPCGHSFGSGGIQQVIGMKACSTCSHPISEDSILPNLSLRTAVQAFRCEEELLLQRSSKRRRERFELDKDSMYGADCLLDPSRGSRGVQFPFAVMDRVIIKGNKRTPPRFVGREAIVTTQCLNGWYVVKTVDNAESVKLQYRSLAKLTHASSKLLPVSNSTSTSKMAPPWQL